MSNEANGDLLNLESIDREIRIEGLRAEITKVAGGEMLSGKMEGCDPALEEAFLEQVLALETHGFIRPFDCLAEEGLVLPAPDEMDDAALTAKLWELIQALAVKRLLLSSTDHLSDRELYTWLWKDALREEMMGFGLPFGNCHLDVLGGCSEEDLVLQMRYYADEEERTCWAAQFPDFSMPPREKPPYDRDRYLPQPGED